MVVVNKSYGSVSLVCETCGTTFERWKSQQRYLVETLGITRTFCSRECKNQSERKPIPPQAIDDYTSGMTLKEVGCKYGVSAEKIRKHLLASGVKPRSKTAHFSTDKNPTKGKGHTEATKARLRAMTIKQFSDPANRRLAADNQRKAMIEGRTASISKLEDLVADELDRLGIPYTRQAGIRDPDTGRYFACADFQLDEKTVIEVNGTYWHADPRVYPNGPIHASQKRTLKGYAKKMKRFKELGIRVIELWEFDLRKNLPAVVAEAMP